MNFTDLPEVMLAGHRTLAVTAGSTRRSAVPERLLANQAAANGDAHARNSRHAPAAARELLRRDRPVLS
jgi:hypothetical protein